VITALILTLLPAGAPGASAQEAGSARFPLKLVSGQRYLSDADGKPFLIQGDSAWSLIAQLTQEDADAYLADRKKRGFNTLLISLIEHQFAKNAPANAYGEMPFVGTSYFKTPNERYFAHADWVLRRAAEYGFLVLLAPAYSGAGGGEQGWYLKMTAAGPGPLYDYGRYLGRRYHDFSNVIWVHGGDDCPSDKRLVRAIAEGIRAESPQALHTAHCTRDMPPLDFWRGDTWLQINTAYTYGSVLAASRREYARPERIPFFLIEAVYENEHSSDEQFLRKQAYYALLSGASGQVFGNNPIWHFGSEGLYPAPVTWQQALDGRGTQSMSHLAKLFFGIPWWKLKPDIEGNLISAKQAGEEDIPVAAATDDRTLAVIYSPHSREIEINLAQFPGSHLRARWFDPANGFFSPQFDVSLSSSERMKFQPEQTNSSGTTDWVLILEASP
jgi:hypothetical protein